MNFRDLKKQSKTGPLLPEGFEPECWAEKRKEEMVKLLYAGMDPACRELAGRLEMCGYDEPCISPACPECMRRKRIWFIEQFMRLTNDKNWVFVTVIFYPDVMDTEDLTTLDPRKFFNRIRKQFEKCDIKGRALGGFEMDFHQESKKWMPHVHFVLECTDEKKLDKFKGLYRKSKYLNTRSGVVNRPVLIKPLGNRLNLSGYLVKHEWSRVEHYVFNGKRISKKKFLPDVLRRESLITRDWLGLAKMMFLYRLRRCEGKLKKNSTT
ncbi:hypothetical protein [Agaribacterium sp. ZY112]|uniref:hypothetical protein n=1 Tax=Agaribacterium sp. ZY112 TaxID=3233574 RepID=UPI0035253825